MGPLRGLVAVCSSFWLLNIAAAAMNDGLYVSSGSDILFAANPDSNDLRSVYKQAGTIVGIAYDKSAGLMFWSTIDVQSRGIYRGSFDAAGNIQNATKIVELDVLEVNSLTYDWVSKHIYWTDSRKRTLEVSDDNGSNRRILLLTGLRSPRGIYADPINGYLFWTDQVHKRIERSQLDGSDRKVIVAQNVGLPNQILVNADKLYWVDSNTKTLESSDLDGGARHTTNLRVNGQQLGSDEHVFGLAIDGTNAFVTKWNTGQLITVNLTTETSSYGVGNLVNEKIFSAVFVRATHQPTATNPCTGKGCEALCLPNKSPSAVRCSCPSYGAKTLSSNQKTCTTPSSVLLYAVASSGFVCYRDPSVALNQLETYVVGRSLRPVAVAYDPVTQVVYWSDVRERTVHSANINGSNPGIILGSQNGVGLVEGMVVDARRRQLFYTNIGSVVLEGTPYSWHRVETISLDRPTSQVKVKTIVTTADKPRGLALDAARGHLYYTDWGSRASVVRVNLDGSDPTLIRTGLDNPNGIAIVNDKIYIVDSHFKTRQRETSDLYPVPSKNGSLYSMDLDGAGFTDVLKSSTTKFVTPFGLVATAEGKFYVSDWGTRALTVLDNSQLSSPTIFHSDIDEVMSLCYSPFSDTTVSTGCGSKSCSDVCLAKNAGEFQCGCNSYGGRSVNGSSCFVPQNFILVADMNSIKIVSLDNRDSNPYIAVQGNPYFANYAALTYDPATQTVYYSDVNRRAVKALYLTNMTTETFYRLNAVIDGLVFHSGALYWSDYASGTISSLPIASRSEKHTTLIRNLKRPRGIRIHQSYIYWTEWGDSPRVARRRLSPPSSSIETIFQKSDSQKLVWPNGLYIDVDRLYFVDGQTKEIFNCSLSGGCQPLPGTSAVLKHAYDIWLKSGVFYYSDWKTGAINAYRPDKPGSTWKVVGDLMRPTQMYVQDTSAPAPTSGCNPNPCASGRCVPLLVSSGCDCEGKSPTYDGKNCTDSRGACSHNGNSYRSGEEFNPEACVNCQCLGHVSYAFDPVFNDSLCRRIECPPLDCPKEDSERKANECCPSCTKYGVRITNCPDTVKLTLPSDKRYVVYDYLPAARDYSGRSRVISFARDPEGTLYEKGTTSVVVSAIAKDPSDGHACAYTIVVTDKTPPTIDCPNNITQYAKDGESVAVQWASPKASDNVGLNGEPQPSTKWGSQLTIGSHRITYTATDTSGLTASCSFTVDVQKLTKTNGACKVPSIANADVHCADGVFLVCTVSCNSGYTMKNTIQPISCRAGNWTSLIDDDLLRETCRRVTPKPVVGRLKISAPDVCDAGIDLKYTEKLLQYTVDKDYVRLSSNRATVTTTGCEAPSKDLFVNVELRGEEGNKDEIDKKLEEMKTELERGFLRVNIRDNRGVRSVPNPGVELSKAYASCPPGQISLTTSTVCVFCSAGKYQASESQCEKCQPNSYNEIEGQTKCKPCADGKQSPAGSFIVDQCLVARKGIIIPPNMLLYVGVGLLILLLVVVVVIVVVCKRRRHRSSHKSVSMIHPNNAYGCYIDTDIPDETYDKIGELEELNGLPSGASNMNHYEGLQDATATGDSYDVIGKEEGKGGCCEAADNAVNEGSQQGSCSSSGKHSPSYLEPKSSTPPYITPVM